MKIQNLKLKNEIVVIADSKVPFDEKGIAEIESSTLHAELLTLANFFPVEEIDKGIIEEESKVEEFVQEIPEVEEVVPEESKTEDIIQEIPKVEEVPKVEAKPIKTSKATTKK